MTWSKKGEMASSSEGRGKKLLDRVLNALRNAGFDCDNAVGYVSWMRHYIRFHDKRHPQEMGMPEVDALLASETFAGPVGASNWAEARRALQFPYAFFSPEMASSGSGGIVGK